MQKAMISIMYAGYVLLCNDTSQKECLRRKRFTCSGKLARTVKEIQRGSVLFLYNADTQTLTGPFTADSEGGTNLEPGTWRETVDEHSLSANIRLEWEELHEIKNAPGLFPFLKDPEKCELTPTQTQRLLDMLEEAPSITLSKKHKGNPALA